MHAERRVGGVGELGRERRILDDDAVERQHRRHALDDGLVQRAARALERFLAGAARHDDLREHRVERATDDVAGDDTRIDAHTRPARRLELLDGARRRQEVPACVLAVEAELDRVCVRRRVVIAELLAAGDAELLAHEVDTRHLLGDGVLDLQARVDLEEADDAVGADEVLAGARTRVTRLAQDRLRRPQQLGVLLVTDERRRRLLHELLVAALQRAVTRRDDDDVAVVVGEALRLDVARAVEEALDEALAAPERRDGLAHSRLVQRRDLLDRSRDLEAASATAVGGLDGNGQAVLLRERDDLVRVVDRILRTGHEGSAGLRRDVTRLDLVAERVDGGGRRPDPRQARIEDGLRELGVLREETVPGVDGVSAGTLRDVEDLVDDEIGIAGRRAAEGVGLIGDAHVQSVTVGFGVDGHGGDAVVLRRSRNTDCDLATVGDQDLGDRTHVRDLIAAGGDRREYPAVGSSGAGIDVIRALNAGIRERAAWLPLTWLRTRTSPP